MSETIKIPRFRKVGRISTWMEKNEYSESNPEIEKLFFSTNEPAEDVLVALISYNDMVSDMRQELKDLLYDKAVICIPPANQNLTYVQEYKAYCYRLWIDDTLEQKYIDLFKGKSGCLGDWAGMTDERLPDYLEDSIDDPDVLLDYSKRVLRGRLPSHLEDVFFKDVRVATEYAFEVIRGFAPVKLPDALHNFVIAESFRNPDDRRIKTYMKACESDPNKTGNSDAYL